MEKNNMIVQLKYVINNWRKIGFSIVFGLILTRSIYNHLDFWQLAAVKKLMYVGILSVLFSLVTYFLLFRFLAPLMKNVTIRQVAGWVALSLIGSAVILTSLPIDIPVPGKERVLEITTTGEQDDLSAGSRVALMEMRDVNGILIPFDEIQKSGEWNEQDGMLVSTGTESSTLTYIFDTGHSAEIQILFNSLPDGGKAEIRVDDTIQTINLYEAQSSKTLVDVPVKVNLLPAIALYGMDILGVGLILFVLSVLFYHWYQNSPRTAMIFLISAGAFSLVTLGLSRPAAMYTYEEFPKASIPKNILTLIITIQLVLVYVIQKKPDLLHSLWYRLPFIAGLLGAIILLTDWNVFLIAPDSFSYVREEASTRPPVYPLFIKASVSGTDFDYRVTQFPEHEPITDRTEPLMMVSRLQKITLFLSCAVLCYVLMGLLGNSLSPLVALLFLLLYDYGYFPLEIHYILSEAIAQVWLFLTLAAFIAFLWKPRWIFLPCGAVCYALLYLTRGAGIFAGVIFAAMLLWAFLSDWKKYRVSVAISIGILGILVVSPIAVRFLQSGSSTPVQYSTTRMPFALQVAQQADIQDMPDEESQLFLDKALQKKKVKDQNIIARYPDSEYMQYGNIMVSNLIEVSQPVARDMSDDTIEQENIQLKTADRLLEIHRQEYLQLIWKGLQYCTEFLTRVRFENVSFSFWLIILVGLVLSLLIRGWSGFSAATLLLTHVAHLVIVAIYGIPIMRYVFATEFLVYMAFFVLLCSLLDKFILSKKDLSPSTL